MVRWFTENPTGVYLVLAALAGLFVLIFFNSRRVAHLGGVVLCLAAAGGVWLIDYFVVTDVEAVEAAAWELATVIERGDLRALDGLISADYDPPPSGKGSIMARAQRYLRPGESRLIRFSQLGVVRSPDPRKCTVRCNASASGSFGTFYVDPPFIGVMELYFKKDADARWRLTGFAVFNTAGSPVTVPN
jgi:hypothetical protein